MGWVTDKRREKKYIYTSLGKSGVIGDRKERLMIIVFAAKWNTAVS